jgi:hypothetical protein
MLETLLWRSLQGHRLYCCVEPYPACVRQETGQPLAHEEKARICSYVAGREQPPLGKAAQAGYFPWSASVFDEIKSLLQNL